MVSSVFIELTNHCNCRCRSCPQSIGLSRLKGYMDFDLFKKVVDQAWAITPIINLSFFGEPTLHPEFLQCLKYLKQRPAGKSVVIYTNFLNVTQNMMNELIHSAPNRIHLSINAATSQTYDAIRSGKWCVDLNGTIHTDNLFEILCNKITHWFNTPRHPKTIHVFTIASYSIHELKNFVQKWLPLLGSGDEIFTKGILSYGGSMLNEPLLVSSPCKMWGSQSYLVVDWQGNVSPCFLDTNMRLVVGSVLDNSLQQIQDGSKRINVRQKSLARTIEPCNTCLDASHGIGSRTYRKGSLWNDAHLKGWQ